MKYFLNKTLGYALSKILQKNKSFYNLHKNESCYLFGNGKSLQFYDLKLFNDKPSIGCNALFSHKDIHNLDLKYYYMGHPLFFYAFWKNPYSQSYEKNKVGIFYRDKIKNNSHIKYFMPLNNYLGIRGDNIHYVHHFNKAVNLSSTDYKMDEVFTMMSGSLAGMIGIALYMGFSNITLVGFDYTLYPSINGYFYDSQPVIPKPHPIYFRKILDFAKTKAFIQTITPNKHFVGHNLHSLTYKELTHTNPEFKENFDILSKKDMNNMNLMNMNYKIFKM